MTGPDQGMFDIEGLFKMAQKLQGRLQEQQAKLDTVEATASAGGGLVVATVNGRHRLVSLEFDQEIVGSEPPEVLQDLTIAAVNMAMKKVDEEIQAQMADATGGLPLPFDPSTLMGG